MGMTFYALGFESGIKTLDEYLLSHSYISGYSASKDDLAVYAALEKPPSSHYVNALRWYNHIEALLRASGVGAVEALGKRNEDGNSPDIKKLEEGVGGLTIHEPSSDLEKLEDRVGSLSIYGTS